MNELVLLFNHLNRFVNFQMAVKEIFFIIYRWKQ